MLSHGSYIFIVQKKVSKCLMKMWYKCPLSANTTNKVAANFEVIAKCITIKRFAKITSAETEVVHVHPWSCKLGLDGVILIDTRSLVCLLPELSVFLKETAQFSPQALMGFSNFQFVLTKCCQLCLVLPTVLASHSLCV